MNKVAHYKCSHLCHGSHTSANCTNSITRKRFFPGKTGFPNACYLSEFLMFTKKASQPSGSKYSDCLWARLLSTRGNPPSSSSSSSPYLAHEGHRARPRQQPGVLFLRPSCYYQLWRSSNRSTIDAKGCGGTMVSVRWRAIERKTLLGCDYLVSVFLSLSSLAPAKLSLLSVLS